MRTIDTVHRTSIGTPVVENDSLILSRLLFTTVGNALNVDEYVSIARFATDNGARWMMEALNLRGDAPNYSELNLDWRIHAQAMELALLLNPEQGHSIKDQGYCRLFYMVTVNTSIGKFGVCPQDYEYLGDVKDVTLSEASGQVLKKVQEAAFLEKWKTGRCPIKANHSIST